jgi:putative PIN family toxin of toxin-antitoxin system
MVSEESAMPRSKPVRIIIDTNLWISFIISKRFDALDSLIQSNQVRLLFSIELIEEIQATIEKPKLKKHFAANSVEQMLLTFKSFIEVIPVKSKVNVCRDPNDDFLLALSNDGKANYLVTGDKDLLSLNRYRKTDIVTFSQFIETIEATKSRSAP